MKKVRDLYPTARDIPIFGKVEQVLGTIEAEYELEQILDLKFMSDGGNIRRIFSFRDAQKPHHSHRFWWGVADQVEAL